MRRMECSDCGCLKSEHTTSLCKSCLEICRDNYKEWLKYRVESNCVGPWHKFRLDNLKWLEECYERKASL